MVMRKMALLASILASSAAFAAFTPVTSSAALGANDYIDWGQVGGEGTNTGSSFTGTTFGGLGFTVTSDDNFGANDGGDLIRYDESSGWAGEFQPGDRLLYHENSYTNDGSLHSVLRIVFDAPVYGVGTQAQSNSAGAFTSRAGYWNPYPGTNIGFSSNSGTNNLGGHSGDAYTGGYENYAAITEFFVVASMDDGSDNLGFAIGQVDVLTRLVPEPGSFIALGVGALALMRRRR